MSTKLPTQTMKEEHRDKFTDQKTSTPVASDTPTIKPLPTPTIPSPPPQKSMVQKYWKFGIAILSILVLLILLVFAVYFIKKPNNDIPTQTNIGQTTQFPALAPAPASTPTPTPIPTPTPLSAPVPETGTIENRGFFDKLFNRKPKPEPIAGVVPQPEKIGGKFKNKSENKGGKSKNSKNMSSTISKALKEMKKLKMKGGCDCNLPVPN